MKNWFSTALGRLRLLAHLEGTSLLLLLFLTMPLKYYFGQPKPNKIIGMAHGILFVLYCFMVVDVATNRGWNWKTIGLALVASVLPFGTFLADRKLFRENIGADAAAVPRDRGRARG